MLWSLAAGLLTRRLCGVQWKGLPYGECTWENFQDIFKADGQLCVDQFQVHLIYPLMSPWHCIANQLIIDVSL